MWNKTKTLTPNTVVRLKEGKRMSDLVLVWNTTTKEFFFAHYCECPNGKNYFEDFDFEQHSVDKCTCWMAIPEVPLDFTAENLETP